MSIRSITHLQAIIACDRYHKDKSGIHYPYRILHIMTERSPDACTKALERSVEAGYLMGSSAVSQRIFFLTPDGKEFLRQAPPLKQDFRSRLERRFHVHVWESVTGRRSDRSDWFCQLRHCRCGCVQYNAFGTFGDKKWHDLNDPNGAMPGEYLDISKSAHYHGLVRADVDREK